MLKFFRRRKFILIILTIGIIFFVGKHFLIDVKKDASNSTIVKKADIKEELTLSGAIAAEDKAVLSFGIAGKVNWVGVREGDWVKKGQVVATLEKEKLEAALRQAWQDFTAAKAASDKYYSGHTSNSESYDQKIERTTLDATQNKAYDDIRIAQENLKFAVLYAPIDGLVVNADPSLAGVNITALNSNYEIVNPATLYLKVTADQTEVGGLTEGKKGTIIFDSYPDEKVEGTIKNISFTPSEDETGTVYDIRVALPNSATANYKYKLGMTADMDFVIKEKTNALTIPSRFIKSNENGKYVLLGKNKKKTYIKTGIESGDNIEIISGLSENDVIYD